MSEVEKTEELPKIDKKLMKEALQEILNDIPAFWAFAQRDKGEKTTEDSSKTETVTPGPSGAQLKDGKGKNTNVDHAWDPSLQARAQRCMNAGASER